MWGVRQQETILYGQTIQWRHVVAGPQHVRSPHRGQIGPGTAAGAGFHRHRGVVDAEVIQQAPVVPDVLGVQVNTWRAGAPCTT